MNILGTSYTLKYNSLDIYLAGCSGSPHCVGCHNPESWDFDNGTKYDIDYFTIIKEKVETFDSLINNIMIFGGEPLDQNLWDFLDFLADLKKLQKRIWLFTRYELSEIPDIIKYLCDYIKTGRYIPELIVDDNIQFGIKLATSNQKIICMEEIK
jgi:anaerobic ribonucleoside-triphosphate reductase activating protein